MTIPMRLVRSLENRNIFVRDRTSQFDGVGHVRVSIGGKQSTKVALEALDEYFSGGANQPEGPGETLVTLSPIRS